MQQWICHIKGLDSVFGAREVERVGRQLDGVEKLVVDYAGETLQLSAASRDVLKRLEIKLDRLGYKILDKGYMVKTVIGIKNLNEEDVQKTIIKKIGKHTFVDNLDLKPLSKTIELIHSSDFSISDFICELNNIGIKASLRRQSLGENFWQKYAGMSLFLATVLFLTGFVFDVYYHDVLLALGLYALTIGIIVPEIALKTSRKIVLEKKFNYELLLLLVIGFTLSASLWFETAFIVICTALLRRREYKLGMLLKQHWALESSYESKFAFVKSASERIAVSLKDLIAGDVINVCANETVPVDGTIFKGEGIVSEANLTSSDTRSEIKEGSFVYAGQILESGEVDIRISSKASDSILAILHRQFESLQGQITLAQSKLIRHSEYFIYLSGLFLLLTMVTLLFSQYLPDIWVDILLSMAIVSSASYIVVSLQYSHLYSFLVAAKNGLYFLNPKIWKNLSSVSTIILDKNSVVTCNKPEVQEVISFSGFEIKNVFNIAASLACLADEERVNPINNRASAESLSLQPVSDVEIVKGEYIKGCINGCTYQVGSQSVMQKSGFITKEIARKLKRWQEEGANILFVSDEKKIFGLITIIDPVREIIPDFIDFAHDKLALKIILLTQDNQGTSEVFVNRYGFDGVISSLDEFNQKLNNENPEYFTLLISSRNDFQSKNPQLISLISDSLRSRCVNVSDAITSLGIRLMSVLNLVVMARKIQTRLSQLLITLLAMKAIIIMGVIFGFFTLDIVIGLEFLLGFWVLFSTYRPVEMAE